jgi:hypothetical protein
VAKNELSTLGNFYDAKYDFGLIKQAYIRKLPSGKYRVFSEKGKNLGTFNSHSAAQKHLREIEYFKHKDDNDAIDLTEVDDITYSALIRELNKQCNPEVVREFLGIFKEIFDRLVLAGEENPADKALPAALLKFRKHHSIEFADD